VRKYKRKAINQDASLHEHEFITYNDALGLMESLTNAAIEAGASKDKMMAFFNKKQIDTNGE
jgi:hypothetical protein